MPAGARSGGSFEPAAVEELSPKVGISYEETEYLFQDFGNEGGSSGERRPPLGIPALFRTPTDAFASFVEVFGAGGEGQTATGGRVSAFGVTLSKAIAIYETNARVITGTNVTRGGTFSFQL